jgi:hypothetical protein
MLEKNIEKGYFALYFFVSLPFNSEVCVSIFFLIIIIDRIS